MKFFIPRAKANKEFPKETAVWKRRFAFLPVAVGYETSDVLRYVWLEWYEVREYYGAGWKRETRQHESAEVYVRSLSSSD